MKRYAGLGFQWSDAWLLLAIAVAGKGKTARLSEVIGTADAINHAIMTHAELDLGVERLQATHLVEAGVAGLAVTEEGGRLVEQADRQARDRVSQMIALTVLLEASDGATPPPSECRGVFVSRAEYDAAVDQHHVWAATRRRRQ
jgi:hypothetical protein